MQDYILFDSIFSPVHINISRVNMIFWPTPHHGTISSVGWTVFPPPHSKYNLYSLELSTNFVASNFRTKSGKWKLEMFSYIENESRIAIFGKRLGCG